MTRTKPLYLHCLILVVVAFTFLVFLPAGPQRAAAQEDNLGVLGLDAGVQPTPAPQVPPDVGASQEKMTLWWMIKAGGWAMWPLGACSVAVIALCVYNGMQLRQNRFFSLELAASLKESMIQCQPSQAINTASQSDTYLARLVTASYKLIDARDTEALGRDRVKEAMEEFCVRANNRYMHWIGYCSIVAQVSPLLGLLGTVSGMIKAFGTMGREGMGDPSRLAANISEALITTAVGLIIAIPAIMAYFIFRNRLANLVNRCREAAEDMLNDLIVAATSNQ